MPEFLKSVASFQGVAAMATPLSQSDIVAIPDVGYVLNSHPPQRRVDKLT